MSAKRRDDRDPPNPSSPWQRHEGGATEVEADRARVDPANRSPLSDVHAAFDAYLLITDGLIIDVPLAVRIAHEFIDSEAVALAIVGPSSSTKTEIAVAIGKAPRGYLISDLTPQTLLSGWRRKGQNQSLITQLKNHVITIKDLTTIISGRPDVRAKVLAQLREILDGSMSATWGNGERVEWEGKVSVLAAVTNVIDQHHEAIAQLGTRFLYVRTSITDAPALARAAITSGGTSKRARATASDVVANFLSRFGPCDLSTIFLAPTHLESLVELATFVSTARTPVIRDRYHRSIEEVPVPEGPMRAVKQLHVIAAAHARMHERTTIHEADVKVAARLAWDSIPLLRGRVLRSIVLHPSSAADDVIQFFGSSMATTVRRTLEDLVLLELVAPVSEGRGTRYIATDLAAVVRPDGPEWVLTGDGSGVPAKPSRSKTSVPAKPDGAFEINLDLTDLACDPGVDPISRESTIDRTGAKS